MVSPQTRNKKHGHLTLIEHHYGCRDCENVRSDVRSPKTAGFPTVIWKCGVSNCFYTWFAGFCGVSNLPSLF